MIPIDYLNRMDNFGGENVSAADCFEALTEQQKKLVENSTTVLEFKAGETIIKQGFVATHVLFVEEGLAKLDVTNDGKTSTASLISKGAFVGIICSFACRTLDFSSVALEKTIVRMINMEVFVQLIRENGEFAVKMIRHMSSLTNNMVHWITRMADKNVEGALGILLLEMAQAYQSNAFILPVSRVVLAEMAGYSKESTINTLSEFNRDGIVKVNGKKIEILQPDRLRQIILNG